MKPAPATGAAVSGIAVGVDIPDAHGLTALHHAALAGDHDEVARLLAQGADPRQRTTARYDHREGVLAAAWDTPIRFAAGQRPYDLAKFMHNRTKWATGRFARTRELLAVATPSRIGACMAALFGR